MKITIPCRGEVRIELFRFHLLHPEKSIETFSRLNRVAAILKRKGYREQGHCKNIFNGNTIIEFARW